MPTLHGAAPAKLNLRLAVLAQENTGYHQIETIFCALELADSIEISTSSDDVTLDVVFEGMDTVDLGPVERNLAVRAARAFFHAARLPPRAAIRLVKRIPSGAGLGGGSSDAATVLVLLNRAHGELLPYAELLRMGAALGSDVPFFISGAALALGWGRGGRLLPLPPLPQRAVLLAVTGVDVATPAAYAALAETRRGADPAPAAVLAPLTDWNAARDLAANDFEPIVFARLPLLHKLRVAIEEKGAAIARMTGSGSVVYGIFEEEAAALAAADGLDDDFPDVTWRLTRTQTGAAVPGGGFEPPLTDPKSVVLPLDDPGSEP
jgi:4-diphosphocytidyl-2-C-methyl-D-erythritol kinase